MSAPSDGQGRELIADLQQVGFTEHEARAYITLLGHPRATAYELAKQAGLPKANAYAALNSLARKQAVQPVSDGPQRFQAIAPEELFRRIARVTEQRCDSLSTRLARMTSPQEMSYVWSILGDDEVHERIRSTIEDARTRLWVKASEERLERYRPLLAETAERGVSIKVVLFGQDIASYRFGGDCEAWLHEGNGIKVGTADVLLTMTRDGDEALVADLSSPAHGAFTRSHPVVALADTLIRHEMYLAAIFERYGGEIQAGFGPALLELRRRYLPEDQGRQLMEHLEHLGLLPQAGTGSGGRAVQ